MVEYARTASGTYEAEDFFETELITTFGKTLGDQAQEKLLAIFEYITENGYSHRMSPEREPIHGIKLEFKKKLIRFACFRDGRAWVLTHGFFKPGAQKKLGKWPPTQLDRAERIRTEHLRQF